MAYAYKAIDELLNPDSQKQNIFGAEGQGVAQPDPNAAAAVQAPVKTSTETEVSSGSGSGGGSPVATPGGAPRSSIYSSSQTSDRAAIAANAGKTKAPQAIANISDQLRERQTRLQDEANNYVSGEKAKQSYNLGEDALDAAASGDSEKTAATRAFLGKKDINPVSEFAPSAVAVDDVDLLRTDAGLKNLVQRGMGPSYSSGMAAFDLQNLRRNQNFNDLIKMLQGSQDALSKDAEGYKTTKRKEVEDYGRSALTRGQTAARDYLASRASAIDAANLAEAKAANERLAAERQSGVADAEKKVLADSKQRVREAILQADPRSERFIDAAASSLSPRDFLRLRDDYSANDFVDTNEAKTFNQIMSLLGKGDTRQAAVNVAPDYTFDDQGLDSKLLGLTRSLRAAEDERDRGKIAQIIEAAKARAAADNERRKNLDLAQIAKDQTQNLGGELPPELRGYYDPASVDPTAFVARDDKTLNPEDVYTADEARTLTELYTDLGAPRRAVAGQGVLGAPGYTFDKAVYLGALQKAAATKRDAAAAAEAKRLKDEEDARREADFKNRQTTQRVGGIPIGVRKDHGEAITQAGAGVMAAPFKVLQALIQGAAGPARTFSDEAARNDPWEAAKKAVPVIPLPALPAADPREWHW